MQARRFAQACGTRRKTDPVDAEMPARMAASLQPDLTPIKDQTIDVLKELLAARRALVKDRTATPNRSRSLTLALALALALTLALLKRQSDQKLKQITARIAAIAYPGSSPGQARPALVAIRFNPPLKIKYDALRAAGKPAKLALPQSCDAS